MDGRAGTLHERWMQRTEAAYRRMFEGKSQEELVTLTQRERHGGVDRQGAGRVSAGRTCGFGSGGAAGGGFDDVLSEVRPAGNAGGCRRSEELAERTVTTRAGDIACGVSVGAVRSAGSFFFPLDVRLGLGTEGYSPTVLAKAVRQASKASSFAEASDDLRELADMEISPTHLQRLSERIGEEWAEVRDEEVEKFRKAELERAYKEPPQGAAAVMLDGGRLQTRAEEGGRGVSEASWRESKVACCLTLQTKAQGVDPQPEPPSKFLEPTEAARLASEVKRRSRPASERNDERSRGEQNRRRGRRSGKNSRDVVDACESERGSGRSWPRWRTARGSAGRWRRRCIAAGWTERNARPASATARRTTGRSTRCTFCLLGFIAILDFLHLLAYLYDAAHAFRGSDAARGWKTYEQWLRWAWSGKVGSLLASLRAAVAELAAKGSAAAARKQTVEEDVDLRDEQPPTHGLPRVPPLGPARPAAPRSSRRSSRSTAESKAPRSSGWKAAPKRCCNCVRRN